MVLLMMTLLDVVHGVVEDVVVAVIVDGVDVVVDDVVGCCRGC